MMTALTEDPLFSADPAHVRWFGERILRHVRDSAPARVLDIGCGDGSLLVYLADAMPHSAFFGIDLSATNITAAQRMSGTPTHRNRIELCQGDYLQLDAAPFDLIVASSSLQGIPCTTAELASKVGRDLASSGYFVHVTPYRCAYNAGLNAIRRILKSARGGATDALILAAARLLHPGQSVERLRERVDYMYLVLRRNEDQLREALLRNGLQVVAMEAAPHTSLGQPRHRLAVMRAPARTRQV